MITEATGLVSLNSGVTGSTATFGGMVVSGGSTHGGLATYNGAATFNGVALFNGGVTAGGTAIFTNEIITEYSLFNGLATFTAGVTGTTAAFVDMHSGTIENTGNVTLATDTISAATINIGNNAGAKYVTMGSTIVDSSMGLYGGTGTFALVSSNPLGVQISSGVSLGATGTKLDYYNQIGVSGEFQNIWAASRSVAIQCARIGNIVTLTFGQTYAAVTVGTSLVAASGTIPADYVPCYTVNIPMIVLSNSTILSGTATITNDGQVTVYVGTNGFFSGPGNGGFYEWTCSFAHVALI